MFSPCLHGFSLGLLSSSHSPKTIMHTDTHTFIPTIFLFQVRSLLLKIVPLLSKNYNIIEKLFKVGFGLFLNQHPAASFSNMSSDFRLINE